MRWVATIAILLCLTLSAYAAEKKTSLPPGEKADSVVVLDGANTKILGTVHYTQVEEGGQRVQKPEPWALGTVMIIRQLDEPTAKELKVTNGTAQVGGAYVVRNNRQLEYLGQVDLSKTNQELAKQLGLKGKMVRVGPRSGK